MSILVLTVIGEGTRKDLAESLRMLAYNLFSEDDIEEIYSIDGAEYNNGTISVSPKDPNN